MKLTVNGGDKSSRQGRLDEEEEEDSKDGEIAGPELPLDEDDAARDDEEGRFFGGGVTGETARALNYIDEQDKENSIVAPSVIYE